MENVAKWKEVAMESLTKVWFEISSIFPNIIGTLVIVILGWFFTKILIRIIRKVLVMAKVHKIDDAVNQIEIVEGKNLNFNTVKVISLFIKMLIYIMLAIMASDILGMQIISQEISNFLGYLPQLFSALIIFMAGLLLANMAKNGIKSLFESMEISGAKIISQLVFIIFLVFISITALDQAGVDTEIISNNVSFIIGGFILTIVLAVGFGAQKIVGDLLKTFYIRKTYEIGQKIAFKNIKGTVESIDGISMTLKTDQGKIVVPISEITDNQVHVED